jgi:hypothetical protein
MNEMKSPFSQSAVSENRHYHFYTAATIIFAAAVLTAAAPTAFGAISWDAEAGSPWWFDPVNWNTNGNINNALPPSNGVTPPAMSDAQINIGTGIWDAGEGVVYDPTHDPFFAAAPTLQYPTGSVLLPARDYGPETIYRLSISRNTTSPNVLTIKSGDLAIESMLVVGRSSGMDGTTTSGKLVQTGGKLSVPTGTLDIAGSDAVNAGVANGLYDYRGGTLDVSALGGIGLRLSTGTTTLNVMTGEPFGAGGVARFVVHNPASGGYIRTFSMNVASFAGIADGVTTIRDPNGTTTGVGIAEFHFENGNTRPIQIAQNLSLNNGLDSTTLGTRSSRLELKLDSAPAVNGSGVPQNLGLFDVDFDPNDFFSGSITGTGSLGKTFNSGDNSINYAEGASVSAQFGSKVYNWAISYKGNITWADVNNSVVSGVTGPGTGTDVVLIGQSSFNVPEPRSVALLLISVVGLACFPKRSRSG